MQRSQQPAASKFSQVSECSNPPPLLRSSPTTQVMRSIYPTLSLLTPPTPPGSHAISEPSSSSSHPLPSPDAAVLHDDGHVVHEIPLLLAAGEYYCLSATPHPVGNLATTYVCISTVLAGRSSGSSERETRSGRDSDPPRRRLCRHPRPPTPTPTPTTSSIRVRYV